MRAPLLCSLLALTGCRLLGFGPEEAPAGVQDTDRVPSPEEARRLPPPPALPPLLPQGPQVVPQSRPLGEEDRLSPGVVLALTVTNEPTLSLERATIGRDGAVFMPFVGRVQAAGRTPLELAEALEAALLQRGYLRDPQVDVQVQLESGRRAYILGSVGRPGAFDLPFDRPMTLVQLIALAGGLLSGPGEADPGALRLIRTLDGQRRTFRISFLDIVGQEDLRADVTLQDGDVVYVPPKQQLFIFGAVRIPGGHSLADGRRLNVDEALALAGGTADTADKDGVLLIRRAGTGSQTYSVPKEPEARAQVEVIAGDTLLVPDRGVRRAFVLGSVAQQGGVALNEDDLTVTKVLALAGGPSRIASANAVQLIRRGADGKKRVYLVRVNDIIRDGDLDRDPVVLPGDIIWVPEGFF